MEIKKLLELNTLFSFLGYLIGSKMSFIKKNYLQDLNILISFINNFGKEEIEEIEEEEDGELSEKEENEEIKVDEDDVKDMHSMFLGDVDIEDIYSDSKTRITSINPLSVSIVDKYTLSFDKPIGIINQEETDAVSVVTFPNTYDILSIYPIHNPKTRVKKI